MAYVANDPTEDEEKQQSAPVAPVGGGAVHLAPSSGVGNAGTGSSSAVPQKDAGGSFASLDKYVTANQGQAQPLADKITGGINDQYNTLNNQNQSILQGINGQVTGAQGYTPGNSGALASEAANPVSFASDANNVKTFQGLLNDKYTGPTSVESNADYQTQQANLNNAISQGQTLTNTDAGRQQLVRGVTATPTSSTTALNSAILSQDPNVLGKIQTAYQPFNSLVSNLSSGASGINKTIASEQADATASNAAANAQLTGQVNALNTGVNNAATGAQTAINQYNTGVGTVQKSANDVQSQIQNYLNSTPQLRSVDLSALAPYLNLKAYSGTAPTAASAATAQDYATQAALQTLAGTNPLQTAINQSTVGQAGTALPSNFQSLLTQLGGLPQAVTGAVGNLGGQINADYAPLGAVQAKREQMWKEQAALVPEQKQLQADQSAVSAAKAAQQNATPTRGANKVDPTAAAALKTAQKKLDDDTAKYKADSTAANAGGDQLAQRAYDLSTGDKWIPGAATNYNKLLTTLNQSLSPIGKIDLSAAPGPAGTMIANTPRGQEISGKIGTGVGTVVGGVLGGIYAGPAGAAGGASLGGAYGATAGQGAYNSITQLSSDISNPTLDTTGLDIATGGLSIGIEQGLKALGKIFGGLF